MTFTLKRIAYAGVAGLAAFAIIQAATPKYYEKEAAIRKEAGEELKKLGITREAAKIKYPTPEINIVSGGCLLPGGTGEVVVKGKFTPGTKLVLESDAIEVIKEELTPAGYRASVKVAANYPPHMARVAAISPVSGISTYSSPGFAVGGRVEWNLEASNGWRVVARTPAGKPCGGSASNDSYEAQFFRKGEAAPFQTRTARGEYVVSNATQYFNISSEDPAAPNSAENVQKLMAKMTDPKVPNAEKQKIMAEFQKMQEQMINSMKDPAKMARDAEAMRAAFGCERMELKLQGATYAGTMRCSPAIGTDIKISGTLKSLGQ